MRYLSFGPSSYSNFIFRSSLGESFLVESLEKKHGSCWGKILGVAIREPPGHFSSRDSDDAVGDLKEGDVVAITYFESGRQWLLTTSRADSRACTLGEKDHKEMLKILAEGTPPEDTPLFLPNFGLRQKARSQT